MYLIKLYFDIIYSIDILPAEKKVVITTCGVVVRTQNLVIMPHFNPVKQAKDLD